MFNLVPWLSLNLKYHYNKTQTIVHIVLLLYFSKSYPITMIHIAHISHFNAQIFTPCSKVQNNDGCAHFQGSVSMLNSTWTQDVVHYTKAGLILKFGLATSLMQAELCGHVGEENAPRSATPHSLCRLR